MYVSTSVSTSNLLIFKGTTWRNCGSTGEQQQTFAQDQAFQKMLNENYQQVFGQNEGLFKNLTTNLNGIINQGLGQQGFTPTELASMNSQNINAAAASNQKLQTAIGENAAGRSTAAPGIESGVEQAERAKAATDVDTSMNNTAANITQKNYDMGRQNFWTAVDSQEKAPSAFEAPATESASATNTAGEVAGNEANAIQQANNGWMGMVSGLASDAASVGAAGKF